MRGPHVVIHMHPSISGKNQIREQIVDLIAPDFRDGVSVDPALVVEVDGDGVLDDIEDAKLPSLVVPAVIEERLSFSAYLSCVNAEPCNLLEWSFCSKNLDPGAGFFQGLHMSGQAFVNLHVCVSSQVNE